jgi:hypothetical protein
MHVAGVGHGVLDAQQVGPTDGSDQQRAAREEEERLVGA